MKFVIVPQAGGHRRSDGYSAFLFLLHPVHDGSPVVDFAHPVRPARIEEDALGDGRFPGVDMGDYSDISVQFKTLRVGHDIPLSRAGHSGAGIPVSLSLRTLHG